MSGTNAVRLLQKMSECFLQKSSNKAQTTTGGGPVQVTWKWPNITPAYTTIGPDEMSTFGFVVEDAKRFALQLYWCPNNLEPSFPPNEAIRMRFKAVSDSAESNTLTVQVAYDGVWNEGSKEMQQHLILRVIQ